MLATNVSSSQETEKAFIFTSHLRNFIFDSKITSHPSNGYSSVLPNFSYLDGFGGYGNKPKLVASLSLSRSASGLTSNLSNFIFDSKSINQSPNGYFSVLPNFLDLNRIRGYEKKPKLVASLGLSKNGSRFRKLFHEFNRAIKFHCEKIPISFASLGINPDDNNNLKENGNGYSVLEDENMELNGVGSNRPKRVLILMSDTGGGHRASAEAIKAMFHQEFGNEYEVFVTDLWTDHTPWPFNQLPRSYSFLVKHGPLWKMTYYGSVPRVVHQSNFAATFTFIARAVQVSIATYGSRIRPLGTTYLKIGEKLHASDPLRPRNAEVTKGLMKYQPDIIISVHPLMQHVPLRVLRGKGLLKKILFTTVVTDLSTCHPTWFHKLVTRCYCPTEEVKKRALRAGLEPSQIKVFGLPVRPSFVKPINKKEELRRELGMKENLPAVLLMGGGEGMGPIEATARALGNTLYDENNDEPIGQILIICGRNKKLANKLSSIDWKIPVKVKGFVTKMEECMGACDCIITKAGPGTIAEAMIRGLPIVLNGYIAGQEAGNVPYVVENGFGKFSKSPKEIARIISNWFGPNSDELEAMSQNALRLARPDAVFKIVHDLHELIRDRQKSFVPQYSLT